MNHTAKVKLPKKYKLGWRMVGDPINWFWIWRFRLPLGIFRPICWITKHHNKIYYPFGVKIKSCIRCGEIHYRKQTTERMPNIFKGEIGEISSVRFIKSEKPHIIKH